MLYHHIMCDHLDISYISQRTYHNTQTFAIWQ